MHKASSPTGYRPAASLILISVEHRWQGHRITSLQRQWSSPVLHGRALQTEAINASDVPLRKQIKDELKRRRQTERLDPQRRPHHGNQGVSKRTISNQWRLTVGLEVHAQLNTERKLFSSAKTTDIDDPNCNVSFFDLAFPGSLPEFQKATLLPALRAAIGLNCTVRRRSTFDRKHYYYQDQPAGYQITQYFSPFAINGLITAYEHDGIAPEDGDFVEIPIKRMQIEQDTAKSILQPPCTTMLDFNRVGHPLIEIITLPAIHHPRTAAACVKKIQSILQSVGAVTTGMEMGGLRADVNVSVSPGGSDALGQRTEIKNLSSFKAVEDAIIAERDRQIAVLESGGSVDGETRGWTLGGSETKKLRGKEGEVDYRYMPDPDIAPLVIGDDLVNHITETLPSLPEKVIRDLVDESKLTTKDAKTLVSLDDGERLDYFDEVRRIWGNQQMWDIENEERHDNETMLSYRDFDRTIGNWVLHELGGLLNANNVPFSPMLVPPKSMVLILKKLDAEEITRPTAKRLLTMVFDGDERSIDEIVEQENMGLHHLPREEYLAMAQNLLDGDPKKVWQIKEKKMEGKLKWFVGQMVRKGEGKVEAQKAEVVLKELLGLPSSPGAS